RPRRDDDGGRVIWEGGRAGGEGGGAGGGDRGGAGAGGGGADVRDGPEGLPARLSRADDRAARGVRARVCGDGRRGRGRGGGVARGRPGSGGELGAVRRLLHVRARTAGALRGPPLP